MSRSCIVISCCTVEPGEPMVPDDNRSLGSYCLLPLGNGKIPGGCDQTPGISAKGFWKEES